MEELPTADQFWAMEDAWVVGRAFFDRIPPDYFPAWASRILRVCWSRALDGPTTLGPLVTLVTVTRDWTQARAIYEALHRSTLELEAIPDPSREQKADLRLCYLAESVAKVCHNRSNPPDPFQEDAGHWIAGALRDFATYVEDPKFRALAWSALLG